MIHGYLRASTSKQEGSPQTQRSHILEYVERQKLCPPEEVQFYEDAATSGFTELAERDAGRVLVRRLSRGDHVIFAKMDRGFRSLRDFLAVTEDWAARGINIHICNWVTGGAIDTSSPMGKFMMRTLVIFAEFERDLIKERTREALRARRMAGIHTSYKAPFGYSYTKKKQRHPITKTYHRMLVPDEVQREFARQVVTLRNTENLTWTVIANRLQHYKLEGVKQVRGDTCQRYYERMRLLGLIQEDGLPAPGWCEEEKARNLWSDMKKQGIRLQ